MTQTVRYATISCGYIEPLFLYHTITIIVTKVGERRRISLAVNFSNLYNPKDRDSSGLDNRSIREVIMVGSDVITVYEPTINDISKMADIQEQKLREAGNAGDVEITGAEMVRIFFPMLTDIEGIEELSDEEIDLVVNNPKTAYMQVEQVIKAIVTEVYKVMILSARTQVLETDFMAESSRAERQILDASFERAAKEFGAEDLLNKVKRGEKELEEAILASTNSRNDFHQDIRREMGEDTVDKRSILPFKKAPTKEDAIRELEKENPHLKASNTLNRYKKSFE